MTSTITVPKQNSNYYGAFPTIGYPNSMHSNDNSNRLAFYEEYLAKGAQPAYNALEYKLEVYNRWGGRIYETTGSGGNFTNGQINWMGQIDGTSEYAFTGVYPWTLSLKNCKQKASKQKCFAMRNKRFNCFHNK